MATFTQHTVIPQSGDAAVGGRLIFACDPLPPVGAYSPQEAVRLALEQQGEAWCMDNLRGRPGVFRFAVLFGNNRGSHAVSVVEATVDSSGHVVAVSTAADPTALTFT